MFVTRRQLEDQLSFEGAFDVQMQLTFGDAGDELFDGHHRPMMAGGDYAHVAQHERVPGALLLQVEPGSPRA